MRDVVSNRNYWWLEPAKEVTLQLDAHHQTWLQYGSNPITQSWLRNAIAYYSTILEPNDWQSALGYVGEQGELVKMMVPQARSFIRQTLSLVTKQRIAAKCLAETKDNAVANDARLGDALCEHIIHDQKLDQKRELALENSSIWGMGFYKVTWRTDKGTPYISANDGLQVDDNGEPTPQKIVEYDGDIEISNPTVYEVYFDSRITDWDQMTWAEVRTRKNRWDLTAQHPELAEEITALAGVREGAALGGHQGIGLENEDLVFVYEAYHKPSPALPKGRMLVYSSSDCIFFDGPNPYSCIPIIPLKPEPILGFGYGYPKICDLLPCQEMFDHCLGAISTNQSAFAVQNILAPRNSNISVTELSGLNLMYFTPQSATGGGKPEALQLTQSAPETFKFADMLKQNMMELSGINSAVRGAPPAGVTSGTAIATLTANALEFMNSLAKADQLALEDVLTLCIKIMAKFASTPRLLSIIGKDSKAQVKEFVGKDLAAIKKVRITTTNPLMNTLAGRVSTADNLLKNGLIKDVQEYFSVLEGEPPSKLYSVELSENDLISSENEALMEGKPVKAVFTDDHPVHIRKHAALINDNEIRMNGQNTEAVLAHIMEHYHQSQTQDPALAAMIRTGKMPQGMPPPPGGAGAQAGPNGPPPSHPMPPPPGQNPAGSMLMGVKPQGLAANIMPQQANPANPAKDNLGRPI